MAEGSVSRKRKHVDEFVRHKATWSGLSEAALRKIYGFLCIRDSRGSRDDPINMGLACKSWSNKYPCCFERFNYKITLKRLEEKDYKMTEKYVEKFAHFFKFVRIELPATIEGSPFHIQLFYPWADHFLNIMRFINRNPDNLSFLNFEKIYMSEIIEFGRDENEAGVVEVVDLVSEEEEEEAAAEAGAVEAVDLVAVQAGAVEAGSVEAVEAGAVEAADSETEEFMDEALALVESSIYSLIAKKKNLKLLSIRNFQLDYLDSTMLLNIVCLSPSICELSLQGLIQYRYVPPDEDEKKQCLPNLLEKLPHLSTLQIDHRLILGKNANPSEVCTMLAQHQRELRVEIWTVANSSSNSYKTFTTDDWNTLKENSKLEVEISLYTESKYKSEMEKIFLPGAPITCITHIFNKNGNFGINDLFRYLNSRNPTKYIYQMNLKFKESVTDLVSTLKPCLERCKNLHLLTLIFVHPVEDLELFLDELVSVLPDLLKFNVTITRINSESEFSRLKDVASRFINRFKSVNIYFDMLLQKM